MANLIPLEAARELVLAHTPVLGTETVDVVAAVGRVAAADLVNAEDVPGFRPAAMDGFAMRAAQLAGASEAAPVALRVVAEVPAGGWFDGELAADECVRIMTGAPVPECCDAVVKYEIVAVVEGDGRLGSQVAFSSPADVGANVRKPGGEAQAGEVVVHAGEVSSSGGVGFLAGCGLLEVETYRRPRVAILATGSELCEPTEVPQRGQIRNSNASAVAAVVAEAGGIPTILPVVRDDYDELRAAVSCACDGRFDMVITTGGACEGDYDFMPAIAAELGETFFTAINMRPGKAQSMSRVGDVVLFSLPGNPSAAYMGLQMLVRLSLRKMQGYSSFERARVAATLACNVKANRDPRMALLRAVIEKDASGKRLVTPMPKQSSGLFGPLQRSNALLVIPVGDVAHEKGEEMECILLDIPEESAL